LGWSWRGIDGRRLWRRSREEEEEEEEFHLQNSRNNYFKWALFHYCIQCPRITIVKGGLQIWKMALNASYFSVLYSESVNTACEETSEVLSSFFSFQKL
jgi:hypothetical protein